MCINTYYILPSTLFADMTIANICVGRCEQ